VLDLVGLIIAI